MKIRLPALLMFIASTATVTTALAQSPIQARALQILGTEIKSARDQARNGKQVAASALIDFERSLRRLRNPASTDGTELQRKYQAVELLLRNLQYVATHSSPAVINAEKERRNVDIEIVTDHRGASCETALGLSQPLPVKVMLTESGKGRSDAWFRFAADQPGHFRFRTDSMDADPALEVFRSCAPDAVAIAANDDSLGLDASVSTSGDNRSPLLVHLTNTGTGGSILLAVDSVNATISGTITDAKTAQAITNANVNFFDVANYPNSFEGNTFPDSNGVYSISLPAGTYYATVNASAYIPQIYQNQPCSPFGGSNCPSDQATQIVVTDGQTVTGIDFPLDSGQRILGQVRSTANQPLAAQLTLADAAGTALMSGYADSVGHYAFDTLPAGDYKVEAQAGGYGSQMYDHVTCGGSLLTLCDLSKAGTVHVASQDVVAVDFALPQLAQITGTVTGSDSQPIGSAQLTVLDAYGNGAAGGSTDQSGAFSAGPLPTGRYYIYATAAGYFSQLFSTQDCTQDCALNLANATPITITHTGQQATADFQLHPLPAISGHVQEADGGAPIANVMIGVNNNPPSSFAYSAAAAVTDANGNYTVQPVPAGVYYVWAISDDHIDQVYSGLPCEESYTPYSGFSPTNCSVSGATLVRIEPGQTPAPVNFALEPSSGISGSVFVRAGTGSDLPASGMQILVYDSAGITAASANIDGQGNYSITDLAPGSYFAVAQGYSGSYVSQLWQAIDCLSNCVPTSGTPIAVPPKTKVTGINFLVTQQSAIVGRVTDGAGHAIAGVVLDLFQAPNGSYVSSTIADAKGFYAASANAGSSYFIATEAGSGGYVDQAYSGISCPLGPAYSGLCSLNNATAIGISSANTLPQIVNFVLQRQNEIFKNGFD